MRFASDGALLDAFVALLDAFVAAREPNERPRPLPRAGREDAATLAALYAALPANLTPLPPLFERLLTGCRWGRLGLGRDFVLLPRHGGPDGLAPWLSEVRRDPVLWNTLAPAGLLQIGRHWDRYDPLCLDFRRPAAADGDRPVALLDHEATLCSDQVREIRRVAQTFRTFVESYS